MHVVIFLGAKFCKMKKIKMKKEYSIVYSCFFKIKKSLFLIVFENPNGTFP